LIAFILKDKKRKEIDKEDSFLQTEKMTEEMLIEHA
jgi:hypothetical protein